MLTDFSPYALVDKATILQEARIFNDSNHVRLHPKRCCQQLTKLLYLLAHGETFAGHEASNVFFGVTKLFQSDDVSLSLFFPSISFFRVVFFTSFLSDFNRVIFAASFIFFLKKLSIQRIPQRYVSCQVKTDVSHIHHCGPLLLLVSSFRLSLSYNRSVKI